MVSTDPVTEIVQRVGTTQLEGTDESLREFLTGYAAKELRSACKIFNVKVRSKNGTMDNKVGYVTVLVQLARSRRESEEAASEQRNKLLQGSDGQLVQALSGTRKTKHCSFRLLNVLFSEVFCDRLGQMGTQPSRRELDAGAVGGLNSFWQEVSVEYVKDKDEYGRLVSTDHRFAGIDPRRVVPHDSAKLMDIWKDTSAKYASAHARATQSGTHESDFYDFCLGQLEALYVSAWLVVRPQAFNAAVGSLPTHCQLDTLNETSSSEESPKKKTSIKKSNNKKGTSEASEVISFLKSRFGSTASKRKMDEQTQVEVKRARIFSELEQLTKALSAATQAGVASQVVGRLEAKVEEYLQRVDDFDALD